MIRQLWQWLFICAHCLAEVAAVHAQAPVTIDAVVKAWHARQERLRSVNARWIDRKTIPRAYLSDLANLHSQLYRDERRNRVYPAIPPEDVTIDLAASLCLDGVQLRYTRDEPIWSERDQKFVLRPQIATFDGYVGKQLLESPNTPKPQALVKDHNPLGHSINLGALVMAFRPMDPEMRLFDVAGFATTGRRAAIDGRSCIQLQYQTGERLHDLWLDPARDFVMVRYLHTLKGRTQVRLHVKYRQEVTGEWVPETWQAWSYLMKGQLSDSIHGIECKVLLNVPAESSQFQLQFPEETVFQDQRSGPGSKSTWYQIQSGRPHRMERSNGSNSALAIILSPWSMLGAAAAVLLVWGLRIRRKRGSADELKH